MIDEHNHGLSLRKALAYTDCSRNFYYYKRRLRITRCQQQDQTILEKTKEIALQRPSYGTRRMAAMLTRVLGKSINRKRVQKIMTFCEKCSKNEEYHTCPTSNQHLCLNCFNTVHFGINSPRLGK